MQKNIVRILIIVGVILLIPLFGNFFIPGWNWGIFDFIVMGALLFFTGLAIDCAIRKVTDTTYRILAVSAIVLAFLAIWTELAVGAVSELTQFLIG